MKAIIYARQSSGSDDVSESVENQIANCKKLAEKEGLEVIGVFQDLNTSGKTYPKGAEAIAENDAAFNSWYEQQTGSKKYRTGFGEVFNKLADVSFVIVDEMTRLYRPVTRSFLESYVNQKFTEHGVKILQVKGGKLDLSKFDQSLIQTLKNAIQDEAIANQKAKAKQQFKKMRDAGILPNGAKAFGLNYVGNKKIEVDPQAAECIKFVFEAIANFTPYNQIIKEANERFNHLFPKCFYSSNLYHIAENPLYCGLMRNTAGELIKAVQLDGQEIVSFDLWQTVQKIMDSRKTNEPKRAKKNWLPFSGKLYCANCGSRLTCVIDRNKVFYWCKNGNMLNSCECAKNRIRFIGKGNELGLYEAVLPLLTIALIERHNKACAMLEAKKSIDAIELQIHEMNAREEKMFDMVYEGLMTEDRFKSLLKKHKAERVELEAQLRTIKTTDEAEIESMKNFVIAEQLGDLIDGHLPNDLYEKLLNQAINKITVAETKIVVDTIYGEIAIPRIQYKNRRFFPKWEMVIEKKVSDKAEYALIDDETTFSIYFETGDTAELADFGRLKVYSK